MKLRRNRRGPVPCYLRKTERGVYKARFNINLGPKRKMVRIQLGMGTANYREAEERANIVASMLRRLGVLGPYSGVAGHDSYTAEDVVSHIQLGLEFVEGPASGIAAGR